MVVMIGRTLVVTPRVSRLTNLRSRSLADLAGVRLCWSGRSQPELSERWIMSMEGESLRVEIRVS